MAKSFTIQKAAKDHLGALLALENDAFADARYDGLRMDLEDFWHFLDNEDGDAVLVACAKDNGDVLGYVAIEFYSEDEGVAADSANIYSFATARYREGQSIARHIIAKTLFEAAEEFVRGQGDHNGIHTETHQGNRAVIEGLTKYFGYEVFGRYERYYDDGADAVRLQKRFDI